MNHLTFPYLPGIVTEIDLPLARYLPPVYPGMVSGRLKDFVKPGEWVLDPFGSTPLLPLEAAGAGYKVLVASNNPVLSLILEILAERAIANQSPGHPICTERLTPWNRTTGNPPTISLSD